MVSAYVSVFVFVYYYCVCLLVWFALRLGAHARGPASLLSHVIMQSIYYHLGVSNYKSSSAENFCTLYTLICVVVGVFSRLNQ